MTKIYLSIGTDGMERIARGEDLTTYNIDVHTENSVKYKPEDRLIVAEVVLDLPSREDAVLLAKSALEHDRAKMDAYFADRLAKLLCITME